MGGGTDNQLEVQVTGDASGLQSALAAGISSIDAFKPKVAALGAVMSGLAVGGIAKSVSAARDWNSVQREMAKVTSPKQAEELGTAIRGMADSFPMATTKLGDLAVQAARFGITGTENITKFVDTVGKMAAATDVSADEAGQAFAKLSSLTGTPISDIQHLGDTINVLGQTAATSSGEIVDSMLNASGTLHSMGMRAQDIAGLSASMNEMYSSSSMAGRALRRLGQEMMDPRKVADLAGALGMTADQFTAMRQRDPTGLMLKMAETMRNGGKDADVLRASLTSFSNQALTKLATNLPKVRQHLADANTQWKQGGSLAREFGIEANSTGAKIQVLQNRINNIAVDIGNQFLPYLKQAVDWLQVGASWFEKVNAKTSGAAAAIGLVVTAVAGLLPALGLFVSAVSPLVPLIGSLGAALSLLTGPIGVVALAIAGLAVAWQKNLFGIRDVTTQAVGQITSFLKGAMPKVKTSISSAYEDAVPLVKGALGELKTVVTNLTAGIQAAWDRHGAAVMDAVRTYTSAVTGFIDALAKDVLALLKPFFSRAESFWDAHGAQITRIVELFTKVVGKLIGGMADLVLTILKDLFSVLEPLFKTGTKVLGKFWSDYGDEMVQVAEFIADVVFSTLGTFLDALETLLKVTLDVMNGDWEQAWSDISTFLDNTLKGIEKFAKKWFTGWVKDIEGWLDDIIKGFEDWGKQLIGASIIPDTFDAIEKFVSKWFTGWIKDIAGWLQDILGDFQSKFTSVQNTVSTQMNRSKQVFSTQMQNIRSTASNILGTVYSTFTTQFNNIRDGVQSKMQQAHNDFTSAIRGMKQTADNWLGQIKQAFTNAFTDVRDTAGSIIAQATNAASRAKSALSNAKNWASQAASAAANAASSAASAAGSYLGLASGGVVTQPTFAMVGEGGQSEAVMPLSSLNTLVQDAAAYGAQTASPQASSSTTTINVSVQASGQREGRLAGRALARELRSHNLD